MTQQLTLVRVGGRLTVSVRGTSDAVVCRLLDSCGLSGTLALTQHLGRATSELFAIGPASRPYRDFVAALGLGASGRPRGIQAGAFAFWSRGGELRAELAQDGTCTGSAQLGGVVVDLSGHGARFTGTGIGSAPWRTRCPGPMVGGQSRLFEAVATAPNRRMLRIELRPVRGLTDDGYVISLHGHLTLMLRRARIRQFVTRQPLG